MQKTCLLTQCTSMIVVEELGLVRNHSTVGTFLKEILHFNISKNKFLIQSHHFQSNFCPKKQKIPYSSHYLFSSRSKYNQNYVFVLKWTKIELLNMLSKKFSSMLNLFEINPLRKQYLESLCEICQTYQNNDKIECCGHASFSAYFEQ